MTCMNDIEFDNDFVPHLNAPARFVPTRLNPPDWVPNEAVKIVFSNPRIVKMLKRIDQQHQPNAA
jgi:hypothetical protein